MLYDVVRFLCLFGSLYLLRFGPNRYSVLLQKYQSFSEGTTILKEIQRQYSVVAQFSGFCEESYEKNLTEEEEMLELISGYFSERDIVID